MWFTAPSGLYFDPVSDLQDRICAKLIERQADSYELSKVLNEPETFILIELANLQKQGLVKPAGRGKWVLTDNYQIKD